MAASYIGECLALIIDAGRDDLDNAFLHVSDGSTFPRHVYRSSERPDSVVVLSAPAKILRFDEIIGACE
jgi:hypothetical protein